MRQGEDVESGHTVSNRADLRLLRVDAAIACRWRERGRTARIVELELCHRGRDFLVGQHHAEHGDGTGQREVVGLHLGGHNQITIVIESVGHFIVWECHLLGRGNRGRAFAVVGNDHKLVRPGSKRQGDSAKRRVALFLRYGLDLRTVSVEDGDVQTRA